MVQHSLITKQGRRLREAREELEKSQDVFAKEINMSRTSIWKWEKGREPIPEQIYGLLRSVYGINPAWLKTGEGEMFLDKDVSAKLDHSPIDLKNNGDKITSGRGRDNKSTIDIWVYSLKRKGQDGNFLPVEKLGIPHSDYNEYIIAYRNPGREMGEVIPSGSIVAINTREKEPISGEIYLFRFHYKGKDESKQYTYVLRRIQVKKGGRGLILLSDNSQLYPPLELDPEDIHDDTIMGRIMLIHGRRYLYDDLKNKTG